MFFLVKYCKTLEEGSFRGRSDDFLWMLLFGKGPPPSPFFPPCSNAAADMLAIYAEICSKQQPVLECVGSHYQQDLASRDIRRQLPAGYARGDNLLSASLGRLS